MDYEILKTTGGIKIEGLFLITPKKYEDERGYFYESWNKLNLEEIIKLNIDFVQDNHSKSSLGVLRGLHYQMNPMPQSKLIRCIKGEIFDVAVDIRKNSKTFGNWAGINLSEDNMKQIWIPSGFAHGFLTLSENAEVSYKTNNYWNKDLERSIKWNDKKISINWPLEIINKSSPYLSKKDNSGSSFKEAIQRNEVFL